MTPEEEIWSKMSRKEKMYYFYQNVTVEPMIALLVVPYVFSSLAAQSLILDKACLVNLKFSTTVCTALKIRDTEHYKSEDAQVSQLVASVGTWTSLMAIFPVVFVMFAGSWSDRHKKRKPFMLAPISGGLLGCISLICSVYFFYSLPMEATAFLGTFFPCVTGGWTVMFMAVFSYIADITTVEMRTIRIGFLNIFCTAGIPFGTALSGLLVKYVGYYGTFSIAAALYILGITYGSFHIEEAEKVKAKIKDTNNSIGGEEDTTNLGENHKQFVENPFEVLKFLRDFCNIDHIKNTFRVVFKKEPENRRKRILLLIIVMIVVEGPIYGEMAVMFLFLRYKFNWDVVQFSAYSTYNVIIHLIGTSFSVVVFSHKLKMDDSLIGIIACISRILSGFVLAFAQTDWQVFIVPLVSFVTGTSGIAMRSIASKLVPAHELGKLNSVYGGCEALTPLLYGPMYSLVYAYTITSLPGAFLLLGGALTLPAIIIFGWMYTQHREDKMQELTPGKI